MSKKVFSCPLPVVGVAKWLTQRIVIPPSVGSSPITHPLFSFKYQYFSLLDCPEGLFGLNVAVFFFPNY